MPNSRVVIMIRKIYRNDFTWEDLENYFRIRQDILIDELKNYLSSEERVQMVLQQEKKNKKKYIRYGRDKDE